MGFNITVEMNKNGTDSNNSLCQITDTNLQQKCIMNVKFDLKFCDGYFTKSKMF